MPAQSNAKAPIDPAVILDLPPYGLSQQEKVEYLVPRLEQLTQSHYEHCESYRNIVDNVFGGIRSYSSLTDIPFFPVSLFKSLHLKSVSDAEVIKVLTSSGTTGQEVSRIYLDAQTARLQQAALVKLVQHFIGKGRVPMVVVDHPNVIRDRRSYSARGAGILGMLQFGHRPMYALNEDMSLNVESLVDYCANASGTPILFFGFTFMVWKHLVLELERICKTLELRNFLLIHSGGWKKLESQRVGPVEFNARATSRLGAGKCINFYGMVEQVGSVFFENGSGFLQCPAFSDVVIRDPQTLQPLPDGKPGLVQVLSALPQSYPGHSILTEDIGVIEGSDDPVSGMRGRYFRIIGRAPRAELRGCSDVYATGEGA